MTISWYSMSISLQSGGRVIFNGYFSVNNITNLVTAFYETINGSTNFNNNILGPATDPWSADNVFTSDLSFTYNGVNITSILLQNTFNTSTPYYNLYNKYWLYKPYVIDEQIYCVVTPISDPTIYVKDGSQLYDFLNSDREQCIITNDIIVNFNLTSSNGIKTILSDNLIKITKI
jgi:hypothetical protein